MPPLPCLLVVDAGNKRGNVFRLPVGCAWAEFYRLGIAARAAAFPPRAFADGEDGKDLGQTKKAVSGDEGLIL